LLAGAARVLSWSGTGAPAPVPSFIVRRDRAASSQPQPKPL
jgi:hypothetical protein